MTQLALFLLTKGQMVLLILPLNIFAEFACG